MENTELKVGDKVYHISNSSIHWVIEKIEDNEIFCSTLIKESMELKKQKFSITSIKKYKSPTIIVGGFKKSDRRF